MGKDTPEVLVSHGHPNSNAQVTKYKCISGLLIKMQFKYKPYV